MKKILFLIVSSFISFNAFATNINDFKEEQGEDCVDFAQEGIQLEMDTFGPMTFTEYNYAFLAWYNVCDQAKN